MIIERERERETVSVEVAGMIKTAVIYGKVDWSRQASRSDALHT